jgi:putative NADH-flavin reductase
MMMIRWSLYLATLYPLVVVQGFVVAPFSLMNQQQRLVATGDLQASFSSSSDMNTAMNRRKVLQTTTAAVLGGVSIMTGVPSTPAHAAANTVKKVVVAGATGQTGRRVLERLAASTSGLDVVAGVRNVDKATKSLSESSTVIRGAMVQQVGSVDTSKVNLQHLDVVADSIDDMAKTLKGADSLVIAIGFVPSNPLKMNEEAHKVDNVGAIKLIDAAKAAGVSKVVMVSSILTNGRAWGQEKSPGFVVTNAFGGVLDEKIVAETI